MKKIKLSLILILILFILFVLSKSIYASFADFSDEDAEKQTQNMIQEHNKEFDSTKSDNNYLKDLKVTGGTLSPNFDRQTLEYTFKVEDKTNQINITATPEDSNAKVNGVGTINILEVSECKIDVIAPSGTTRTYLVKIIKQNEENNTEGNNTINNISEDLSNGNEIAENKIIDSTNEKNTEQDAPKIDTQNKNYKKYIVATIVGVSLIILFCIFIKSKKNNM